MRAKVLSMLPRRHHMTQSEVRVYLGDQLFKDAVLAGWIVASLKRGEKNGTVFYRAADAELVSQRVAAGEYPAERKGVAA